MMTKITVIAKDSEKKTLKREFLAYENTEGKITLSHDDEALKSMVDATIKDFGSIPEDVIVKAVYVW